MSISRRNFFKLAGITTALLAIGIAFISTLIQSLTGFGFAIVSTPLLLMVYDAKEVVVLFEYQKLT